MRNGIRLLLAIVSAWPTYQAVIYLIDRAPFLTPKYGELWERSGVFLLNHIHLVAFICAFLMAVVVWWRAPQIVKWFMRKGDKS